MDENKNPEIEENYEFDDLDVNIHFNDGEEPEQSDEEDFDDEELDCNSDCECHHEEHSHSAECHHHNHGHSHNDTEDEEEDNTCDLDPTKICNNCGACLNFANMDENGYASILIDQIDTQNASLDELYKMYGLDQEDED